MAPQAASGTMRIRPAIRWPRGRLGACGCWLMVGRSSLIRVDWRDRLDLWFGQRRSLGLRVPLEAPAGQLAVALLDRAHVVGRPLLLLLDGVLLGVQAGREALPERLDQSRRLPRGRL